ncbi:MAG: hypothetical protein JO257_23550 [Deltaproteobacteria bacterium]|nr:hypothetical protein [Deltaproteobacteria bacterium]
MNRLFSTAGILIGLASVAHAQASSNETVNPYDLSIGQFNPEAAVAPGSIVEGAGIKVGEGTVLRPVFGLETGVISNVFYANTQTQDAGVLRLMAQIGASSLGGARINTTTSHTTEEGTPDMGSFEYRLSLRAAYDLMLSSDDQVSKAGGLGLGASFHAIANPMGRFSFGIDDDFMRLIRAADFETDANLNRDINNARLVGIIHPRGSSLSGYLYYQNTIDVFEQSSTYPDRMSNTLGLHPMWQWLPQTQVYMDASLGVVSALGTSNKVTSYPLSILAGIGTLLTYKTTLNLSAGYTNGFYTKGPSFNAPQFGATFGYRYSPLGRVMLGYQLMYSDSINANYYRDHVFLASLQQLFNPFVLMVQPELHLREYNGVNIANPMITGPDTRDDTIFAVTAGMSYSFRNWFAATLSYRFSTVQTNYTYTFMGTTADPSFTRHEALLGVRIAM